MLSIRKILLATDFSPACTQAYFHALKLARLHAAEVIVAHVMHPVGDSTRGPDYWRAMIEQIRPVDGSIAVGHALLEGEPARELVAFARANDADLIVLGRQGRHDAGFDQLGSVTEEVLRNAPCSVLVARLPKSREHLARLSATAHMSDD